jgi:hypothetical protein
MRFEQIEVGDKIRIAVIENGELCPTKAIGLATGIVEGDDLYVRIGNFGEIRIEKDDVLFVQKGRRNTVIAVKHDSVNLYPFLLGRK